MFIRKGKIMKIKGISISITILSIIIPSFVSIYLLWFVFAISKNIKGMIFANAVLLILALAFIIGIFYEDWIKHE